MSKTIAKAGGPRLEGISMAEYLKQEEEYRAMVLAAQAKWLANAILLALPAKGNA